MLVYIIGVRRNQAGIDRKPFVPPKDANRAVKEYLATLDDAAFGAASDVTPKLVSP
jgi:hypothetical protein